MEPPYVEIVAWLHLLATWFMVGLVWFVQCVHYPLLRDLPPGVVPSYQLSHMRRTVPLIPAVMLAEALSSLALVTWQPPGLLPSLANLLLLAGVWALTFAWIIPVHERLAERHDAGDVTRLLRLNLVRSLLWLAHGGTSVLLLKALT